MQRMQSAQLHKFSHSPFAYLPPANAGSHANNIGCTALYSPRATLQKKVNQGKSNNTYERMLTLAQGIHCMMVVPSIQTWRHLP